MTRTGETLPQDKAEAVAEVMQALASPARVQILDQLHRAPCSVGELATTVGMEQSAVSNHLRLLRHLGLVTGRREGRRVLYSLHDQHVATLVEQALTHIEHRHPGLTAETEDTALAD
ncbi:ArsR family transcriptional regulator [Streptomyces zinciresistens K42]|uniref:ArsR family transcriptional regulator n=1 Tax=Streptomyces zinciresistens K42 TaxID=700597 RepID=G2GEL4_9ACTN|nr:metalloregulator ArsR/SmtB family transcription factor [Streptomyces zinciresistens]EGX58028.1 ArsR family transcriptional regulator [Streptomyces zinciresistens K42]